MSRVHVRFGSGAEIGNSHHGFRFPPDPNYIGVDFGLQPREPGAGYDGQELSDGRFPEFTIPQLVADIMPHHFITHSHLDHTGALPLLYKMYRARHGAEPNFTLYMSEIALETTERLLWEPTIRMADQDERPRPFDYGDIAGVRSRVRVVRSGEVLDFEHFRAVAFDAGHVPGALYWIFIPKNGADPVFTSGDISFRDLGIVKPAAPIPDHFGRFSVAVMEATYLGKVIPDRKAEMARLRTHAREVLARRGTLVVPVFSIGSRGLEVGADFEKHNIGPVYYDGMLKDAIRLYKDLGVAPAGFSEKNFVRGKSHMEELIRRHEPKVVIAAGGMLPEGSRAWLYAADAIGRYEDGVAIVGFQGPGTPGECLVKSADRGMVQFGSRRIRRGCTVEQFQLSAHADGSEIEALLARLDPDTVVFNHGESANIDAYIAKNSVKFPWKMIRASLNEEVIL
jgi:Cft2 family RNA processing exonuclease